MGTVVVLAVVIGAHRHPILPRAMLEVEEHTVTALQLDACSGASD